VFSLLRQINNVSKRTKFQIRYKGKVKVNPDIIKRLTKYRYPYFIVEVFISSFIAILLQIKRANIKLKNDDISL